MAIEDRVNTKALPSNLVILDVRELIQNAVGSDAATMATSRVASSSETSAGEAAVSGVGPRSKQAVTTDTSQTITYAGKDPMKQHNLQY